ncbi:MAG TPA: VOC family protein [Candidatus Binataceae bacterium]|jgi:catechol 2,3-dioxygenase-like lactoylglutathione lyase family enzyme|nr:VOC family protein [Candidatus Binataceae bacterium]
MKPYIDAGEQLVAEFYVREIARARDFLRSCGFELIREEANFAELRWERSLIFLEAVANYPEPSAMPVVNIRVMVRNVDEHWQRALANGARVIRTIGDRYYGLRDFTIAGPDGIALRFATILPGDHH